MPIIRAIARIGFAPQAGASITRGMIKLLPSCTLDHSRCALIIQEVQNDVVMEGGALAASGSPNHSRELNAIPTPRASPRLRARAAHSGHPCLVRGGSR